MARRLVLTATLLCIAAAAHAEVADLGPTGFLTKHEFSTTATPADSYKAFATEVTQWWNSSHTYSGSAANLSIDARPGGCFCEKLPDGGGAQHMTVAFLAPGKSVRLVGGLGPLGASGVAGSMTWKFTPAGTGTKVEVAYSVGGYMQGGFDKMAPAVDFVVGEQLGRLKNFIETGKPVR